MTNNTQPSQQVPSDKTVRVLKQIDAAIKCIERDYVNPFHVDCLLAARAHIEELERAVLAAATPVQVEADAEFEILQDDHPVASSFGPRARAAREALHYAAQYAQDGELTIVEVTRKAITIDALKSASVSEQKGNV